MRGSRKNAKKLHFGDFKPKWAILDSFWPKWPKRWKLSKKRLENFCRLSMFYLTAKFQKKSNERFSRNCVTYERTNKRDSLGLQRLQQEPKKK